MTTEDQKIQVKQCGPFKFKDKEGRGGVRINMKNTFGFTPDDIVIQKVIGQHDTIIVSAIMTPAEIEKENLLKLEHEKARQKGAGVEKGKKLLN